MKKRMVWNKGKKLSKKHKQNLSFARTLNGYIQRLGIQEGTKAYYEKNKKLSVGIDSLRNRGYSEKQIKAIRKKHKQNSMTQKKDWIEKYGEKKGLEKWNNIQSKKRNNNHRTLQYWIRFFDGDINLAKEALKKVQGRSEEFFKKRYGDIDGKTKYREHVMNKTKSFQNRTFNNSKTEIEIGNHIKNNTRKNTIMAPSRYYIYLNEAEQLLLHRKFIIPDITIPESKIIIEYYGDYWHCNAYLFKDENEIHPYIKKTIKEIRENDIIKMSILNKRGWKVIIIWEYDYKTNKHNLMEELINEINKE